MICLLWSHRCQSSFLAWTITLLHVILYFLNILQIQVSDLKQTIPQIDLPMSLKTQFFSTYRTNALTTHASLYPRWSKSWHAAVVSKIPMSSIPIPYNTLHRSCSISLTKFNGTKRKSKSWPLTCYCIRSAWGCGRQQRSAEYLGPLCLFYPISSIYSILQC